LELLVIMARARGMSHIILHYVRDAPLCGITDWDACEEHQLVIAQAGASGAGAIQRDIVVLYQR
jgi:hypothetical protein